MRYFCVIGLMAALVACGSGKEKDTPKSSEFVMPPEAAGNYSDSSGQSGNYDQNGSGYKGDATAPSYQGGKTAPSYTDTKNPGDKGVVKEVPAIPVTQKGTPLAPVQTQKEVVKGYTPACCLIQSKADLTQKAPLVDQQALMGCYALDQVCSVYPTQCVVAACPADLVL